jgi:outer membrane immunogenic protein
MRTKFWSGIGMLASIAASVGAAGAADLATKAPVYKAPPPPVILSDWAGFYIGINGGGAWATTTFDANPGGNTTLTGGLIGGHAGYNWQFGSVVVGVEGDGDGAFLQKNLAVTFVDPLTGAVVGNGTLREKTEDLFSARARLGYVVLPQLLVYGTAGAGWGDFKVSDTLGNSASVSQFGWVAGGGLEYKVWGPLIARVEYLHYGFDNKTVTPTIGNVKESIDAVRGGLSYKF